MIRSYCPTLARAGTALVAVAMAASLAACGSSGSGANDKTASPKSLKIGVLQIASAPVLDSITTAFEKQLSARFAPQEVSFDFKNAQGDQSLVTSITRTFAESDADGFAAIGTPAVISLAQQVKDKPIFALAMGDPVGAKVAKSLTKPGGNVTGSIDFIDPAELLKPIMEINPEARRIGTIYDPSNQNMRVWVAALKNAVGAYPGTKVVESTISGAGDTASAARSLAGRVDIEMIGPDATVFSGLAVVGSSALGNKIPVYVAGGDVTVPGILASLGPDYSIVGKLGADVAYKVLSGAKAADTPFALPATVEIAVNRSTLKALGITLPADIAKKATIQ